MLLCIVFFTGCNQTKNAEKVDQSDEIKIGVVLPLSGEVPSFGISSKNAIDMLITSTNIKGGLHGKRVEVIYEDDKNIPQMSIEKITKLIKLDRVVGVIGSISSKCSIAMGPIATENKIPMITPISTSPMVTTVGGEYVFRACFVDTFQGKIIARFAIEDLKADTAATLYDSGNEYSKGLAEFFESNFERMGGKVVLSKGYTSDKMDIDQQLREIAKLQPDVLMLSDYYNNVATIAQKARRAGITAQFIGGDGWDSPTLSSLGGKAINGGYFTNHFSADDIAPEVVNFRKEYEKLYGSTPDAYAATAYDAVKIMLDGIDHATEIDGESIKESLMNTDLDVVTGHITFDGNRNPIKGAVVLKVNKNEFEFVKKINP